MYRVHCEMLLLIRKQTSQAHYYIIIIKYWTIPTEPQTVSNLPIGIDAWFILSYRGTCIGFLEIMFRPCSCSKSTGNDNLMTILFVRRQRCTYSVSTTRNWGSNTENLLGCICHCVCLRGGPACIML